MCYDTALTKMKSQVQEYFQMDFAKENKYKPYFHRSGFTYPKLQIIKMEDPNLIHSATWGYVPEYGMDDIPAFRKKYNTLNIRSESLFSGLSKEAAYDRRCLIIADGFFEPHRIAGDSIPYFCYIPSKEFQDGRHIFAFGGIYSEVNNDPNELTCSLLTMEANSFFKEVHNLKKRQPFVIDANLYEEWFDPNLDQTNVLELVANGFTSKKFEAYSVSTNLYRRDIDSDIPSIIEEVPPPGLLF